MNLLVLLPWWVTLTIAGAGYAVIEWLQREAFGGKSEVGMAVATGVYAPLWLGFFVFLSVLSAVHRRDRERLVDEQSGLESLKGMPWKAFEHLVAEAFERKGFRSFYTLDRGADGGVDVELRKDGRLTLVQCKKWKQSTVGVPVVREMFGILHARGADEVMVVTTGGFSPDAMAFAKGKPIKLIDGEELWKLVREVQQGATASEEGGGLAAPPDVPGVAFTATEEATGPGVVREMTVAAASPCCPNCGGGMRKTQAKRGKNAGKWFWGCERYPDCRGSVSI